MFELRKMFRFEACHSLPQVPDGHPCGRLHGHSYRVELVFQSEYLDYRGFAGVDYAELQPFADYLDDHFDHRNLNDVVGAENTTAERLARHFFDWAKLRWPQLTAVRVSETEKTWATYMETDHA